MEVRTLTRFVALLTSILLTLTTGPVQAGVRCTGKWKIHACLGGNGKRSMPSSNHAPSLASRLREARQQALRSAVQASYETQATSSLLARLLRDTSPPRISDKLVTQELNKLLQEDNDPRQREIEPVLKRQENEMEDDFSIDDVTSDETDMTPVDMRTVQDIFTALTLQRALRTDDLRDDTRDEML